MTDIPTDEAEREYRAMIAILDIAAKGERTLSASFAGQVRDELASLRAEKADLVEALEPFIIPKGTPPWKWVAHGPGSSEVVRARAVCAKAKGDTT